MLIVFSLLLDCWCVFIEILSTESALNPTIPWVNGMVHFAVYCSKSIVVLFVVDVVLHVLAFGFRHWLSNRLYVLDGFVVAVTFVLEFVVHPLVHKEGGGGGHRFLSEDGEREDHSAERNTEAASLVIVVLRSWRFVRLFHGLAFSEKLRHDEHLKQVDERKGVEMVEQELEKEVEELKQRIRELEGKNNDATKV